MREINNILLTEDHVPTLASKIKQYFASKGRSPTQEEVNHIKDYIQNKAVDIFLDNTESLGIICMATGVGKSRTAILLCQRIYKENPNCKILIVVPTTKLRDENWKGEFEKWGAMDIWNNCIWRSCYASIAKFSEGEYDLVIFDECHSLTPNNIVFLKNNICHRVLGLTATPPKSLEKILMMSLNNFKIIFEVSLESAVNLNLVAPYKLHILYSKLDEVTKNIKGGTKSKPFMTTEKKYYDYLNANVNAAFYTKKPAKFPILNRMRFLKSLPSKQRIASSILGALDKNLRILVFCGSIKQADELSKPFKEQYGYSPTFHSKSSDIAYKNFKEQSLNILFVVDSINEGHDFPNVDGIFIVSNKSSDIVLTQRIGRSIRFRFGHIAFVILLVTLGTQEEKWLKDSTVNISEEDINRYLEQDLNKLIANVNEN